jgi:hypothetical protein
MRVLVVALTVGLVLALGLALGCQSHSTPSDEPSGLPKPPGPPARLADELYRLEGQSSGDLLAEFGEPTRTREFTMGQCCENMEIGLRKTYPSNAGHDDVRIRQWDWDYDGYKLTVWLHLRDGVWQVVETLRHVNNIKF